MDWKLLATAFGSVFIAEIGDKTQLAAFALSGGASSKWTVFIGASLALIAATAIAVLAAGVVERYLPLEWIKRGAVIHGQGCGIATRRRDPGGVRPFFQSAEFA